MNNKLLFSIFIILLAGVILLLASKFPNTLQDKQNYPAIITSVLMLIALLLGIFHQTINWQFLLKNCVIWLGIILLILSGYSYQYELKSFFNRIIGNVAPSLAQNNADGSVTLYAGQSGHFIANAEVNGSNVQFLVDTGASFVLLTPEDAKRAGFNPDQLSYNSIVQTANGTTSTALVTIDQIQIGDITVKNIPGGVSHEGDLDTSLLGMSFLTKLKSYNVSQGMLIMSQ